MADTATQLAEAEQALHRLLTGSLEETVQIGDRQVTYTRTTISDLEAYVTRLSRKTQGLTPRRRIFRLRTDKGL